jgi:hypothetical protein
MKFASNKVKQYGPALPNAMKSCNAWKLGTVIWMFQTTATKTGSPNSSEFAMQDDENQLEWRDTYFILFKQADRPTLTQVEAAITESSQKLILENLAADDDGLFESVLVQVPQDNAALEISYEMGEAVSAQSAELAKQLKDDLNGKQLQQMLRSDARFDIMLFERVGQPEPVSDGDDDEWEGGSLDPSSLLNVVDALAKLTRGLPIDPASGSVLA